MNVISLALWTLENNCLVVYTGLIVCFVGFTIFHKTKLEAHYRTVAAKKEKFTRGGTTRKEREFPDDGDDDPELPVPAIPEDTPHIPHTPLKRSDDEILRKSREYYELMAKRRTVKSFSDEPMPQEVLNNVIKTVGISPSGAHTEPRTFMVTQDKATKTAIREMVEEEEKLKYCKRMSRQWLTDLKPFWRKPIKPYLSDAPALLLVFRQTYAWRPGGKKRMHYDSEISIAIAAGFLLPAMQYCGLVALITTSLNYKTRLREVLPTPVNERLKMLPPVAKSREDATVSDLNGKPLEEKMRLRSKSDERETRLKKM